MLVEWLEARFALDAGGLGFDLYAADSQPAAIPTPLTTLAISDQTVVEGDSGTVDAAFTVTLSGPFTQQVTVDYATADGTATAQDYVPTNGMLTFTLGGPVTATIHVTVVGDLLDEGDETFRVNLTNPTNAGFIDASAQGTILDDDDLAGPTFRADVLGRVSQNGQWWLARSTGSAFTTSTWGAWQAGGGTWLDVQPADVNGDGLPDIIGRWSLDGSWWVARNVGAGEPVAERWGQWSTAVTWRDVHVGDFDGDGNDDIAGRVLHTGQWWVAESDGADEFGNELWGVWSPTVGWVDVRVGDFDGDGNDDLAGRTANSGDWWIAESDGVDSFGNELWGRWSTAVTWLDVRAGDFNGDGDEDLIGRAASTGQWWVALSNGVNDFDNELWGRWSTAVNWLDVRLGDYDGDGFSDLAGRSQNAGQWWVARSNGQSALDTQLWGAWPVATWNDVRVGDFTGDGRDDLVGRNGSGQLWVSRSNGSTAFIEEELWGTWANSVTWLDVMVQDFLD